MKYFYFKFFIIIIIIRTQVSSVQIFECGQAYFPSMLRMENAWSRMNLRPTDFNFQNVYYYVRLIGVLNGLGQWGSLLILPSDLLYRFDCSFGHKMFRIYPAHAKIGSYVSNFYFFRRWIFNEGLQIWLDRSYRRNVEVFNVHFFANFRGDVKIVISHFGMSDFFFMIDFVI